MFRRLDLLALSASLIATAVTVFYVSLVLAAGHTPTWWAVVVLVVCAGGAGYAARPKAPYRRPALVVAAVGLLGLGYLSLFTIGLPLLLAGAFCAAAALRHRNEKDWRDSV